MFEDISKVLLITDMDGTFLPSSKIPGRKTLEAVDRFQKAGGKRTLGRCGKCRFHHEAVLQCGSFERDTPFPFYHGSGVDRRGAFPVR